MKSGTDEFVDPAHYPTKGVSPNHEAFAWFHAAFAVFTVARAALYAFRLERKDRDARCDFFRAFLNRAIAFLYCFEPLPYFFSAFLSDFFDLE